MVVEQLDSNIKNSKNILLVSHINPDGDTLGSMCAMYSLIRDNYKKSCEMVVVSKFPEVYTFLPNESYFSSKRKDALSYEVVEGAFRNDRS